jgi:hypothetical protein
MDNPEKTGGVIKNGQSRENRRVIKNGQSRDTYNLALTRHRSQAIKT